MLIRKGVTTRRLCIFRYDEFWEQLFDRFLARTPEFTSWLNSLCYESSHGAIESSTSQLGVRDRVSVMVRVRVWVRVRVRVRAGSCRNMGLIRSIPNLTLRIPLSRPLQRRVPLPLAHHREIVYTKWHVAWYSASHSLDMTPPTVVTRRQLATCAQTLTLTLTLMVISYPP